MRWLLPLLLAVGCAKSSQLEKQLESEVIALQYKVRSLEQLAKTCSGDGPGDRLFAELNQVFNGSEVAVKKRGRITILEMPVTYLFSERRLDVRDEAKMGLDLLATALNLNPKHSIRLEGHAAQGPVPANAPRFADDNWMYTFVQAHALLDILVDDFGVSENRFTLISRSSHQPISDNDTESGKTKNRRIVVFIYPPGMNP